MKSAKKLFDEILGLIPESETGDPKGLATEMTRASAEFYIAVYGGYASEAELEAKAKLVLALAYRTYRSAR